MNYVSGGLLGDLLNVLYVIKSQYIETGIKGNLYITNDPKFGGEKFNSILAKTYLDTYNLITNQDYINQYKIYDNTINENTIINLSDWRQSRFLYIKNWIDIFSIRYNLKNISYPWIKWHKYNNKFQNKILIHRGLNIRRHTNYFPWTSILNTTINNNNNKYIFITCDKKEYDNFQFNDLVELEVFDILEDLYTAINSCLFFIGNQSMPLAFAVAIGKPCLAELCVTDYMHYTGIEKYNKNFFWIHSSESSIKGADKYITLPDNSK